MNKNFYFLSIAALSIISIFLTISFTSALEGYTENVLGHALRKDTIIIYAAMAIFPVIPALNLQINLGLEKIAVLLKRNKLTHMFQQISKILQIWAWTDIGIIFLGFALGAIEIKAMVFLLACYVVVASLAITGIILCIASNLYKIYEMNPTDQKIFSWFKMFFWGYMLDKKI